MTWTKYSVLGASALIYMTCLYYWMISFVFNEWMDYIAIMSMLIVTALCVRYSLAFQTRTVQIAD